MEPCAVRVAVRVRPLSAKEVAEGATESVLVVPETNSITMGSGKTEKSFMCVMPSRTPGLAIDC